MPMKSLGNDRLRNFSVTAIRPTDACFELFSVDNERISLLDNCRPGKMAASISELATDRYFHAIHAQGRS
jgi:hypothetical protein